MRRDDERNALMEQTLYEAIVSSGGECSVSEMIEASGMTRMQCVRIIGFCIRDGLVECRQKNGRKTYRAVTGK